MCGKMHQSWLKVLLTTKVIVVESDTLPTMTMTIFKLHYMEKKELLSGWLAIVVEWDCWYKVVLRDLNKDICQ